MYSIKFLCFSLLLAGTYSDEVNNRPFSKDFEFAAATASYQVEGGWNEDGKGENIWDNFVHRVDSTIVNKDTGDVACDSYHKWREDVAILKSLGVGKYRFSISWSRILPEGVGNKVNEMGVNYYKNLIKELKANDIEPFITIFHWDLPQPLEDAGGWPNEQIVEWYANYAKLCFELFGDSVKQWLTFNEPKSICNLGYGIGMYAPGIIGSGIADYQCAHNLLKAHARAWHIYNEEFRPKQNGIVGIAIDMNWMEPATSNSEDEEAAETARQFTLGWYANPVFFGDYPEIMKKQVANRSIIQGYKKSRLPEFTDQEKEYLKGTIDFLGYNTYSTLLVKSIPYPDKTSVGYAEDSEVEQYQPNDWENTICDWIKIVPWGIRKALKWVKDTYNNPKIFITENGVCDDGSLEDDIRVNYIKNYLSNIKDAMDEDGVNVVGYTAWSLLDNFEWSNGYSQKYGLYRVDFSSANRTRVEKKSAAYYRKVIHTRCLVDVCEDQ